MHHSRLLTRPQHLTGAAGRLWDRYARPLYQRGRLSADTRDTFVHWCRVRAVREDCWTAAKACGSPAFTDRDGKAWATPDTVLFTTASRLSDELLRRMGVDPEVWPAEGCRDAA